VGSSGLLPAEEAPWFLNDAILDVPAGITLTIAPGAVVKFSGGYSCPYGDCGWWTPSLTVEGTLDATGTASEPVTMTSVNDNSVGGTTGSGNPAAGDWTGIWDNGSIDMSHAFVEYAEVGIGNNNPATPGSIDMENSTVAFDAAGVGGAALGTVVLENNTLQSIADAGFAINAPSPTIEGNEATDVGTPGTSTAFSVNSTSLDPSLLGGNSASGGWPLFQLVGTVGSSGLLPAEEAPWFLNDAILDVPAGITLTIAPGAVVKGDMNGGLAVEGTLDASGTATNPIVFTSINDNTVGGLTGTGFPAAGDWSGIFLSNEEVDSSISYAMFRYASAAVSIDSLVNVSVTDSLFAYDVNAFTAAESTYNPFGLLPCNYPYTNTIEIGNDYFGSTGEPGASLDVLSFLGLAVPDQFQAAYGAASSLMSVTTAVGNDDLPWALFTCAVPDTDIQVAFPVTPVLLSPLFSSAIASTPQSISPEYENYVEKDS
jgi:hypothetical protein